MKMHFAALTLLVGQTALSSALPRLARRAAAPAAFASSSDGKYQLTAYTAPVEGDGDPGGITSTWDLTLDDSDAGRRQSVNGFGAAITDATVVNFNLLSADTRSQLLDDLFGPDGLGFSLMRHTIAASDLSATGYSYDDSNGADTSLANFGLGDNGTAMAGLISDIRGVRSDLTLLGSVWSPPGWMKLNNVMYGTTENNNLNHDYVDAWAQYFVKYIQAFNAAGANVDAVTIQNEPLNSQSGYPTMYIFADESAGLIQNNLGPALADAGLSTQVWAYDHNTGMFYTISISNYTDTFYTDQPDYPQTVLDGAGQYVNTVAWHCYAPNNDWGVLTNFHNTNPSVTQYMTECWTSPETGWSQAADFTMGPLQNWASGAIAWTLGTDTNYNPHIAGGCTTCRGLVVIDPSAGTYTPAIDYYMLGQFSKYIPKGATILSTTGSYDYGNNQKVEATASLNPDGTRTVVIENGFNNDVYLTLTTQSGQTWSGPLYAQSVVTWLLPSLS